MTIKIEVDSDGDDKPDAKFELPIQWLMLIVGSVFTVIGTVAGVTL